MAAPRMRLLFASIVTFMNPCVSPFSIARATRVIGRFPERTSNPARRASASLALAGADDDRVVSIHRLFRTLRHALRRAEYRSRHQLAAVDLDDLPGDESGKRIRCEKDKCTGAFLGRA